MYVLKAQLTDADRLFLYKRGYRNGILRAYGSVDDLRDTIYVIGSCSTSERSYLEEWQDPPAFKYLELDGKVASLRSRDTVPCTALRLEKVESRVYCVPGWFRSTDIKELRRLGPRRYSEVAD